MATTSPGMLSDWYNQYLQEKPQTQSYTAAQAGTTDWNPDEKSTVQGQLTGMLAKDSPLFQRAETRSLQQMNDRGLTNSSMAVGAGQAAVIDAATPIAQQDANTFASAGQFNANAKNTAAIQNTGMLNDSFKFGAGAANDALGQQRTALAASGQQQAGFAQQSALQDKDLAGQLTLKDKELAAQKEMAATEFQNQQALQQNDIAFRLQSQTMDAATKQSLQQYQLAAQAALNSADNASRESIAQLNVSSQQMMAEMESKWRVQLQASASMTNSYQSMIDSVTRIMMDPNLDAAAKATAIENTRMLYDNALGMLSNVSGLDLGSIIGPDVLQAPASSTDAAGGTSGGTTSAPGATEPTPPGLSEPYVNPGSN